jgi:hypothetical protein
MENMKNPYPSSARSFLSLVSSGEYVLTLAKIFAIGAQRTSPYAYVILNVLLQIMSWKVVNPRPVKKDLTAGRKRLPLSAPDRQD